MIIAQVAPRPFRTRLAPINSRYQVCKMSEFVYNSSPAPAATCDLGSARLARVNQAGAPHVAAFEQGQPFAGVPADTQRSTRRHNLAPGGGETAMASTRDGAGCNERM